MTAPPGWYPDPKDPPGYRRWWDGQRWTEHVTQPKSQSAFRHPLALWLAGLGALAAVVTEAQGSAGLPDDLVLPVILFSAAIGGVIWWLIGAGIVGLYRFFKRGMWFG